MINRFDPFREMMTMRRAMDRLIDTSMPEDEGQPSQWGLALDVVEQEDNYLVRASLPGIKADDLDITFNKGVLTIHGELKDDSEITRGQYHLRERRYGTFSRSISLPATVKAEDIKASYNEGVLTLTLPKAEEVKPKRIPVKSTDSQKMVEGKNN